MVTVEQYSADVHSYKCQCGGGRVGSRCESISGCHPHQQPCHNGGVCVADQQSGVAAGRCLCPSGFTGRFCEVDIDDCASYPCVNGQCTLAAISRIIIVTIFMSVNAVTRYRPLDLPIDNYSFQLMEDYF